MEFWVNAVIRARAKTPCPVLYTHSWHCVHGPVKNNGHFRGSVEWEFWKPLAPGEGPLAPSSFAVGSHFWLPDQPLFYYVTTWKWLLPWLKRLPRIWQKAFPGSCFLLLEENSSSEPLLYTIGHCSKLSPMFTCLVRFWIKHPSCFI